MLIKGGLNSLVVSMFLGVRDGEGWECWRLSYKVVWVVEGTC